jgi:hypothetical protein
MMKLASLLGKYFCKNYSEIGSLFIILPIDIQPVKYFIGIAFLHSSEPGVMVAAVPAATP